MKKILKLIIRKIKRLFKSYYCIKQHDITDCAAACLATISKHYDLEIPITQIREIAGTDKRGTNALGVIKAAKKLGFEAKGVKGQSDDLTSEVPLPAIAHVVKDNLMHYVVVYEINEDEIVVADPAEGMVYYDPEDFYEIWTGVLILITPTEDFETGDEKTGFFERFLGLITPHKGLLVKIFFASMLYTLLGIAGSFYFKYLIDTILADGLVKTLHIISIGIVLLTLFKILMNFFRKHLLLYLSQKIDISLILNYYQHVLELPMSFFDSRKVGEILSRLRDTAKIRQAISGATITVMIDSLLVAGGGIVLYIQSSTLFWVAAVIIPLYVLIVLGFSKPLRRIHRKEMENSANMQSYLIESVSGVATIKAFNGEEQANLETESRFIKYIKSIFKATFMRNIQGSLQKLLTSVSEFVILWVGGLKVINGVISVGQLITFNALLAYFYNPIQRLINLQPKLMEAYVAADRLGEIFDLEQEKQNESKKIQLDKLEGKIEVKDVNFRYGTRKLALENINLDIEAGEKIALVGESGSGKTTLAKLILKYYLPDNGEILLDGYNIKDINLEILRQKIGYVPQDVFLFSGTLRENISFGFQDIAMKEIINAARKSQIHQFINQLPLRYNTMVGERGSNLSGGQKQRIAIARAILKDPDLLILDEATSNLDTATEKAIHNTIEDISQDITTIIIAHRLSTIMQCDKIVVLDEGEIIELGTHQQLIQKQGKYYQLWQGQTLENNELEVDAS
ncbi:ABC-type bacteriocin transporter [Halobacteroides halobius DSM 5150]|uniref:ABC-type bacteriocin transporter n=1 Tax=Halobacteroides halobius (strain ATCC 35273 / DSM 5150 / MD-1) TaxID=748449 RepID=L0KBD3_HALHC|nr:peptidase domain-containing ABC transporter [Halobacteroides halobius]AGB41840.1 ABC-type bacteriocin transporter [Halobacteroides halobius DSM 5150]